jgi:predicted RNA binding protein YcfA (HicA-like mRNA interferase family)
LQKNIPRILKRLSGFFDLCTAFPQDTPRIHNRAYGIVGVLKRTDLIRHLEANGCVFVREGGSHSVYFNPAAQRTSTVPRHREVKNPTAIRICKQLGLPDPR